MNLRKPCLPPGWYPQNSSKISEFLNNFSLSEEKKAELLPEYYKKHRILAAVAPHAGWYYSGTAAARAVAALAAFSGQCETVVVIGGHLPEAMPALFAMEDAVSTPRGEMEIDNELRTMLIANYGKISGFRTAEDRYHDNTVEVLLPMVKYFFPTSKLLWLRLPAAIVSFEAGKTLAKTAAAMGKKIAVLGSTDLTHYGSNYGFSPKGYGQKALDWVKNTNDRRFIDAVEAGDPQAALDRAEEEHSACSAGAVLGVMGFAEETTSVSKQGSNSAGKLLVYSTSADIALDEGDGIPDSFVGYGAFIWNAEQEG